MIEIYKEKNGKFNYRLIINDKVIFKGRTYIQKISCKDSIYSLKKNIQKENIIRTNYTQEPKVYDFIVWSENGRIIAFSCLFDTQSEMENVISILKKEIMNFEIKDLTKKK